MDLRVLVVCADQDAADLLSQLLSEVGIEAGHTTSIADGLEQVEEQRFDAIILDYRGDESSKNFLAKLRLSGVNRNTLLIAIIDGEYSARPVFGLGASFVLYRPLSVERTRVSLRAARGLMRRERRRAPRIPITAQANLDSAGAENQRATLLDLSDGGTALRSDRRVPPRCKVYFQFALPGQQQLVRLSGEVAWQDASGRTGIRFVDVPQASRRLISAWLMQNSFKARPEGSNAAAPVVPPVAAAKAEPSLAADAGNRRGERRFPCTLGAEVYRLGVTVPNRCTLSDVSEGGCYVEMNSPFAAQSGVEIVMRTADMKVKIRGQVQAVHPGFGMGVRFMFRDAAEREEVLRLLGMLAADPSLDEMSR
jgi:DNA-binding response OmpR family regulator